MLINATTVCWEIIVQNMLKTCFLANSYSLYDKATIVCCLAWHWYVHHSDECHHFPNASYWQFSVFI